jgi:hypothetical protein
MYKKTPESMLKIVGVFLVERCKELGYIPIITKTPPFFQSFPANPSKDAVFIKLFGHFNYQINTVHSKFGVLDPKNLSTLGHLCEKNLHLTEMDKYLLISSLFPDSSEPLLNLSKKVQTLQDIYEMWSIIID